jgi:single-strand DNA-binding protein
MATVTSHNKPHKNEVHLAGVLAKDPEIRYTASGKAVATVTVVTTYEKRTQYHRVVAWEKRAERLGEHFHKDDFIEVTGYLQTRSYEKDGEKHYVTEVIAWNLSDGTTTKNAHGVEVSDADLGF